MIDRKDNNISDKEITCLKIQTSATGGKIAFGRQLLYLSETEASILSFLVIRRGRLLAAARLARRVYGHAQSRDPVWQLAQDVDHLRERLKSLLGRDLVLHDPAGGYGLDAAFTIEIEGPRVEDSTES